MDASRIETSERDDAIEQALDMFPADNLAAMRLVFKQAMTHVYNEGHRAGYAQAMYDEGYEGVWK